MHKHEKVSYKGHKFMSVLSSLSLLKLRIVSLRNLSYQKQWGNFRNQDFQTNSAHLITMDRKMIPTDPRTNRETQSVHYFIYNVPQLPSLSSNTGGRWQKIVACNNNLSQQPTTPIHSQQHLRPSIFITLIVIGDRRSGLPVGVD